MLTAVGPELTWDHEHMPVDIAGAVIQTSAGGISITTSNRLGLNIASGSIPQSSNRPYFVATGTNANATTYTAGAWTIMSFNYAIVNVGNGYSISTYAFTAPVTGTYHFTTSTYNVKRSGAASDEYMHPTFLINGSWNTKQAQFSVPYRIRGRTYSAGAWSFDGQINGIHYLTAGDYVQCYNYAQTAHVWYPSQGFFSGYLIG